MEYQYQQPQSQEVPPQNIDSDSKMLQVAFWFGIASLVCTLLIIFTFSLTMIPAMILGSLSILFSILSKGKNSKMKPKAFIGSLCSSISLSIHLILICLAVYLVTSNAEFQQLLKDSFQEANQFYEENYGISLDEMYPEYSELLDDLEP